MGKYESSSCVRRVKNSVGEETYSLWRGIPVVKKKIMKNTSNTPPQARQRTCFAEAYNQSELFTPASEAGEKSLPRTQTPQAAFMGMNANLEVIAVSEEPDEKGKYQTTVNYPKIRCSKGRLRIPRGMAVTADAEGRTLNFSHAAEGNGPDRNSTDKVYALVVEPEAWDSELFDLGTRAESEPVQVALPDFWDMAAIHIYVFVVSANGKSASDSLYLTAE